MSADARIRRVLEEQLAEAIRRRDLVAEILLRQRLAAHIARCRTA